ncbi:MAG: hypothetical protein LBL05_03380 [Synergistaceae bacterium]|nr:hypothetical protein [Synergistaceae bacterium]
MKETRGNVAVVNWFSNSNYRLSMVEFTDGTV